MASLSSLGLNLRLADIDENLKSHPAALSWPNSNLGTSAASTSHDFIDDVPCFAYTEVFESGDVFQAVSPGSGIYLPLHSSPGPSPAFTVSKCRLSQTIEVEIQSVTLWQSLAIAMPSPFDFPCLLSNYAALKSHLQHLETISPSHPTTVELRLLVRDLLLDRALYAGVGTEGYRARGLLSLGQLHDMHQRSVDAGLDDLDACFALGLLPDVLDDAFLEALTSRFTELALAGDMTALHDLCEPVVRSGEVEWQTNPTLLLELLDRGRLDIYRYVLDLASRTRDNPTSRDGPFLQDITHDPLHVAIRLGHTQQVESLLQQGTTFLGVHLGDEAGGGVGSIVLTPISAAVLWGQAAIVRLILQKNLLPEGLQEAVAIAVSNSDSEIMQIMLSSGAMDDSFVSVADDTFTSLADVNIIDQTPVCEPLQQMPDETVGSSQVKDPQMLFDERSGNSSGDVKSTHRQRRADAPKEPVRRKPSRHHRRLLGQDLVSYMQTLCSQFRTVCTFSSHADLHDLAKDYVYPDGVWNRGLDAFRKLMQDCPPSALMEVVDSLLIANAICLSLFKDDDTLLLQFVNDLHRWRSILPGASRVLFDDLAFRMWAYTPSTGDASDLDLDNLPYFQELVQNLSSLERSKESAPTRVLSSHSRLAAIQRTFETQEAQQGVSQPQAIPGRSQSMQAPYAGSSTQRDDLMWGDFLHMECFEDTPSRGKHAPSSAAGWEDVLSSTMLLLASVAFSIVLGLILGLHSGSRNLGIDIITTTMPGQHRSCALVSEYLAMHDISIRPPQVLGHLAVPSFTSPSPAYGSEAGITPSSSFSSLSTLGLRRNVSSSSISSVGSVAASSPSRPASRDHQPRGNRLSCLTPQCTKTFSSVSNRNKHLREGCAFTREKRQGYQCRNGLCTRVLTTKWYRDTHEKNRCRFR